MIKSKLTIKTVSETHFRGRQLALFDEQGRILPMQESVKFESDAGGNSRITVTFRVDGNHVRLEDSVDDRPGRG